LARRADRARCRGSRARHPRVSSSQGALQDRQRRVRRSGARAARARGRYRGRPPSPRAFAVIGAAVIGLGVGEQHARAIAREPDAKLAWVYDHDRGRADALARELGTRVAGSYEQILADPDIGVVALASYDDHHAAEVLAAFAAGKHVFCEKPLCRTPAELAQIVAARGQLHLQCNLILRAAPLYRWLRDAIRAGELGDVYAFDGDYLYGRLHKITDGWRKGVEDYSVIQGGGVHLIDLMMWLLDEAPRRVTAAGNRIATRDTEFRYLDFAAA